MQNAQAHGYWNMDMKDVIYECTKGIWYNLGHRAQQQNYVISVAGTLHNRIINGIYKVKEWNRVSINSQQNYPHRWNVINGIHYIDGDGDDDILNLETLRRRWEFTRQEVVEDDQNMQVLQAHAQFLLDEHEPDFINWWGWVSIEMDQINNFFHA